MRVSAQARNESRVLDLLRRGPMTRMELFIAVAMDMNLTGFQLALNNLKRDGQIAYTGRKWTVVQ